MTFSYRLAHFPGEWYDLLMITLATFLEQIDRARGARSDQEISRAAGFSANAVARMRGGALPSLERAAQVADVVGLELVLRPKGEVISLHALQLSMATVLLSGSWGDAARGGGLPIDAVLKPVETFGMMLAGAYRDLEPGFRPPECDNPAEHYREMVNLLGLYHRLDHAPPTEADERLAALLLASGLAAPTGAPGPALKPPDQESDATADAADATTGTGDETPAK